jgi:hypothetical protein
MAELKPITSPASFSTELELEALLLEGVNSGPGIEVTPEFWAELHSELDESTTRYSKAP